MVASAFPREVLAPRPPPPASSSPPRASVGPRLAGCSLGYLDRQGAAWGLANNSRMCEAGARRGQAARGEEAHAAFLPAWCWCRSCSCRNTAPAPPC